MKYMEDRVGNEYMFFFHARSRKKEKDLKKNCQYEETVKIKRKIFRDFLFTGRCTARVGKTLFVI